MLFHRAVKSQGSAQLGTKLCKAEEKAGSGPHLQDGSCIHLETAQRLMTKLEAQVCPGQRKNDLRLKGLKGKPFPTGPLAIDFIFILMTQLFLKFFQFFL
jgi:hypothetical protein